MRLTKLRATNLVLIKLASWVLFSQISSCGARTFATIPFGLVLPCDELHVF